MAAKKTAKKATKKKAVSRPASKAQAAKKKTAKKTAAKKKASKRPSAVVSPAPAAETAPAPVVAPVALETAIASTRAQARKLRQESQDRARKEVERKRALAEKEAQERKRTEMAALEARREAANNPAKQGQNVPKGPKLADEGPTAARRGATVTPIRAKVDKGDSVTFPIPDALRWKFKALNAEAQTHKEGVRQGVRALFQPRMEEAMISEIKKDEVLTQKIQAARSALNEIIEAVEPLFPEGFAISGLDEDKGVASASYNPEQVGKRMDG